MRTSLAKARPWLFPIILTVVSSLHFFTDIASNPLHGDENWYPTSGARFFSLLALDRDLDAPAWHSPSAWNQPMIGRYLLGAVLWLEGDATLVREMAELPSWEWHRSKQWNLEHGRRPPDRALLPLRFAMAGFGVLACLCVYFLGALAVSAWAGFLAALLLGFNPLTTYACRLAMTDAPLLFFMTLMPILSVAFLKSYRRDRVGRCVVLSLGVGIVGALATGTKLNGAVSLIAFGVLLGALALEATLRHLRKLDAASLRVPLVRLAALLATAALTAMSLFTLSQPNFYGRPVQAAEEMVWNRAISNRNLSRSQGESQILGTATRKLVSVVKRTLLPGGFTIAPVPVEAIFFPLGLLVLCRNEWRALRQRQRLTETAVVLIWLFVTFVAITLWIPFDWDRYYLPLLPPLCLTVATGLTAAATRLWQLRPGLQDARPS